MTRREFKARWRRTRAAEATLRSIPYNSGEWRTFMAVVTFSSEHAQKVLDAAKDMSKKRNRILVKEFLTSLVAFLPSEESYKRKKDEGTDKQKRRKLELKKKKKKEKTREREEELPKKKVRRRVRR